MEIKGYISISQMINIVIYSYSHRRVTLMEGIERETEIVSPSLYVNRLGNFLFLFQLFFLFFNISLPLFLYISITSFGAEREMKIEKVVV